MVHKPTNMKNGGRTSWVYIYQLNHLRSFCPSLYEVVAQGDEVSLVQLLFQELLAGTSHQNWSKTPKKRNFPHPFHPIIPDASGLIIGKVKCTKPSLESRRLQTPEPFSEVLEKLQPKPGCVHASHQAPSSKTM